MRIFIRDKAFSLTGAFKVLNENKEPIYNVKGKFFSIRRKKTVCDLNGKVLYRVQNRFFNWLNHCAYILDAENNKVAKVTNKFYDINGSYIVEDCKDEISVEGKFLKRDSKIIKNGNVIGNIRKEFGFVEDHFVLDAESDNIPFLIALVIAMDNISNEKKKKSSSNN